MKPEQFKFPLWLVAASIIVVLLIIAILFLYKTYSQRKSKLKLDQERIRMQFEKTLLESSLEIQGEALATIDRELHSNIGQILSLARINLSQAKLQGETEKVSLVDELLAKVIVDLRALCNSIHPDIIGTKGWLEPLNDLLQDLQNKGKFTTQLNIDDDLPILGKDRSVILFRILQEIIHNIIKDAKAGNIYIDIKKHKEEHILRIKNNGTGHQQTSSSATSPVNILHQRAKMINANLVINNNHLQGTVITIVIKPQRND